MGKGVSPSTSNPANPDKKNDYITNTTVKTNIDPSKHNTDLDFEKNSLTSNKKLLLSYYSGLS